MAVFDSRGGCVKTLFLLNSCQPLATLNDFLGAGYAEGGIDPMVAPLVAPSL